MRGLWSGDLDLDFIIIGSINGSGLGGSSGLADLKNYNYLSNKFLRNNIKTYSI